MNNKDTLEIFFVARDSELLNTTLDSLLRQTHEPIEVTVLYKKGDANIANMINHYDDTRINAIALSDLEQSTVDTQLQSLENPYVAIVSEGSVFYDDWALHNINALKVGETDKYYYLLTNLALLNHDGVVLSSSNFASIDAWAMASHLGYSGNTPALFMKRSNDKLPLAYDGTSLPSTMRSTNTVFSPECYYAVRSTATQPLRMGLSETKRFGLGNFHGAVDAHREQGGSEQEDQYVALYAAFILSVLRSMHLLLATKMFVLAFSKSGKRRQLSHYLKQPIDSLLDTAFGQQGGTV